MASPKPLPPIDAIGKNLIYSPDTGEFIRKSRKGLRRESLIAGQVKRAGIIICVFPYGWFPAHRLAWKIIHGEDPSTSIDHIDGNPYNNKISNLREATGREQCVNTRAKKNTASGLKGAFYTSGGNRKKKWRSAIRLEGGSLKFLGYFLTAEDAHAAYIAEARIVFGEFMPSDERLKVPPKRSAS